MGLCTQGEDMDWKIPLLAIAIAIVNFAQSTPILFAQESGSTLEAREAPAMCWDAHALASGTAPAAIFKKTGLKTKIN